MLVGGRLRVNNIEVNKSVQNSNFTGPGGLETLPIPFLRLFYTPCPERRKRLVNWSGQNIDCLFGWWFSYIGG